MPRRVYSPDEKATALETLNRFGQDIAATSLKLGIPRRTLYTWRMEEWDQQRQRRHSQPPSPPINLPTFDTTHEALEHLRTRMFTILNRIPADLSELPPYLQRDREAARLGLVDIIIKLTTLIGIPQPEVDEIQYVYEYPDQYPELIPNPKPTPAPKPEPKITHIHRTPDGLPPPNFKNPVAN